MTPTQIRLATWEATGVWPVHDQLAAEPEMNQACTGERTPASYHSYVQVDALDGCLHAFENTMLELDQAAARSVGAWDLEFEVDGFGNAYLKRLTQAHMAEIDGRSNEACPSDVSSTGSWPDSIRLSELGTNRLCVLTNGGAVVELRLDPYYRGEGPLTIHYRTIPEAIK